MEPNTTVRRRIAGAPELLVALDRESSRPLYQQVYDALREAILAGRLPPGQRVPSSRVLAGELGIGRNTVMRVLAQLRTEGYVAGNRGGGTRVRPVVPDAAMSVSRPSAPRATRSPPATQLATGEGQGAERVVRPVRLSGRGAALAAAGATIVLRGGGHPVPFQLGMPAIDAFPSRLWARLAAQRWRKRGVSLGEGDPGGEPALRAAIAEYVGNARGVRCVADQVIVVGGTQQGLDLVARVLLEPGDAAWVEDPGYPDSVAVLRAAGARPVPVPVDLEGLDVSSGERLSPDARLACVTPSHQFPLGAIMGIRRRMALLAWARRARAWIFEDDYDSEFRYTGSPLPSLQGLDVERRPADTPACVLYAGTFNKTLVPGLRLGYLIVPEELVDALRSARVILDRHAPSFPQVALTDFIGEGHYVRHLRRMRALYAERQAELLAAADAFLSGHLALEPDSAGLHLVGWLPAGSDDVAASARATEVGVATYPLSNYRFTPCARESRGALLLGYAPFDRETIRDAARRLARALERT